MRIQDLLNQAKPCWKFAATNKDNTVCFYSAKPVRGDTCWMYRANTEDCICINDYMEDIFDIELDGDWKDSLIEREE